MQRQMQYVDWFRRNTRIFKISNLFCFIQSKVRMSFRKLLVLEINNQYTQKMILSIRNTNDLCCSFVHYNNRVQVIKYYIPDSKNYIHSEYYIVSFTKHLTIKLQPKTSISQVDTIIFPVQNYRYENITIIKMIKLTIIFVIRNNYRTSQVESLVCDHAVLCLETKGSFLVFQNVKFVNFMLSLRIY